MSGTGTVTACLQRSHRDSRGPPSDVAARVPWWVFIKHSTLFSIRRDAGETLRWLTASAPTEGARESSSESRKRGSHLLLITKAGPLQLEQGLGAASLRHVPGTRACRQVRRARTFSPTAPERQPAAAAWRPPGWPQRGKAKKAPASPCETRSALRRDGGSLAGATDGFPGCSDSSDLLGHFTLHGQNALSM